LSQSFMRIYVATSRIDRATQPVAEFVRIPSSHELGYP
jgi:hypothetical protein